MFEHQVPSEKYPALHFGRRLPFVRCTRVEPSRDTRRSWSQGAEAGERRSGERQEVMEVPLSCWRWVEHPNLGSRSSTVHSAFRDKGSCRAGDAKLQRPRIAAAGAIDQGWHQPPRAPCAPCGLFPPPAGMTFPDALQTPATF